MTKPYPGLFYVLAFGHKLGQRGNCPNKAELPISIIFHEM